MTISPADLAELERLEAAATRGEWHASAWEPGEPDRLVCAPQMPSGQKHVLAEMITYDGEPSFTVPGEANARFIAVSRNMLPQLIAAAREAERYREALVRIAGLRKFEGGAVDIARAALKVTP